jgi:PilZ domain
MDKIISLRPKPSRHPSHLNQVRAGKPGWLLTECSSRFAILRRFTACKVQPIMTLEPGRKDQRRYKRIQLSVPARFLADGGTERTASLLDISVGGLALTAGDKPPVGVHVVIYLDHVGRVEGHIVRHLNDGFAVEFMATEAKRERLTARLAQLTDQISNGSQAMESIRVQTAEKPHFILEDGREIECRVLDMSVHGVWLQVGERPAVGEEVTIGRMRGRVRCHHATGVEIEFVRAG